MNRPTAQEIYRDTLHSLVGPETEWLDLGCGRELVRSWLPGAIDQQHRFKLSCKKIVGIDSVADDVKKNPYLTSGVVGNILDMPFPSGSFNLVTANMVIEHVDRPEQLVSEVKRVLRLSGHFVFVTPNVMHPVVAAASLIPDFIKIPLVKRLEKREQQDIFPTLYRMNTVQKCRRFLTDAGFQMDILRLVDTPPMFPRIPIIRHIDLMMDILGVARRL